MRLNKNPVEWRRAPKKAKKFELGTHIIRYPLQENTDIISKNQCNVFNPAYVLAKCWGNTPWLQHARNSFTFVPILPPTVGSMIDNYADMSFKIEDLVDITTADPSTCPCHSTPNARMWTDDSIGHIRTFDASIIRWGGKGNNFFFRAARKGRDFRPPWCQRLFLKALITFFNDLAWAFDQLLTQLEHTTDTGTLRPTIKARLQAMRELLLIKMQAPKYPLLLPDDAWDKYQLLIRAMHQNLTFTRTDKAENTPNTVCTAYYRWNIYKRLTAQGEMCMLGPADTVYTLDAVRKRVWSVIGQCRLDDFPIICLSGKAKKLLDPNTSREQKSTPLMDHFITCAFESPHLDLSAMLCPAYKLIQNTFYELCIAESLRIQQRIGGEPLRLFWFVDSLEILPNLPTPAESMSKWDHSRMFEILPQRGSDSITSAQNYLFGRARHQANATCMHIYWKSHEARWVKNATTNEPITRLTSA